MSGRGWEKLTPADIARLQTRGAPATPKPSKYRNVRVTIDNHTFDSKREATIYAELKMRQNAGEVRNLQLQVPFPLFAPAWTVPNEPNAQVIVATYVADFVYEEHDHDWGGVTWSKVVADCKGGRTTQMFQLKKRWLFLQSGIEIRELR